jgi:hypothetical protein
LSLAVWEKWLAKTYVSTSGSDCGCPIQDTFEDALTILGDLQDPVIDIDDADFDGNTMLDKYEVALLAWGLCSGSYAKEEDLRDAYFSNLNYLRLTFLEDYDLAELFAALYTISQDNIDIWQSIWSFAGTYAPYTVSAEEVFAADGDLDGDSDDNETEYDVVIGQSGTTADYMTDATDNL